MKKGLIWRVGNGKSIHTWWNPWIPRGPPFLPITPKRNCRLKRVSDFLNNNGVSNTELLNLYFYPADVVAIRQIRTSPRQQEDFLAWQPDSRGCFSVRSAYHLAMEDHEATFALAASSSSPDGSRNIWNVVWQAAVPHRICVTA